VVSTLLGQQEKGEQKVEQSTPIIIEFKSINWLAKKFFYLYKLFGVLTIPLISILFIISTANLLSGGNVTTTQFDVAWAVIYSICFEMNGLRLVIDARIEQLNQHQGAARVDYGIGIALVILGTSTTFIEGLVNAKVLAWSDVIAWVWLILLLRSLAVIAMIIRECVHYAPLINQEHAQGAVSDVAPVAAATTITTAQVAEQTQQEALKIEAQEEVKALPEPKEAQEEEEKGEQLPHFTSKHQKPGKIIVKTVSSNNGEVAAKIAEIVARYRAEGKALPSQGKLAQEAECSRMSVIRFFKDQKGDA
jgi:hypothetical protein